MRGWQRSDEAYVASVCKRGEPITPTTASWSRDHIDQSGSEFGAVPRATANMAALGAGEHSAEKKRFLRLSSILPFLLPIIIVDLVVVVIRLLSIFGDSSNGEREEGSSGMYVDAFTWGLHDDCESNEWILLNREFYLLILRRLIFRKCFRKIILYDRYVSFVSKIILTSLVKIHLYLF